MHGILWIAAHPEMSLLAMVMGATLILPANSGKYNFFLNLGLLSLNFEQLA
jgi:hypothetical protein